MTRTIVTALATILGVAAGAAVGAPLRIEAPWPWQDEQDHHDDLERRIVTAHAGGISELAIQFHLGSGGRSFLRSYEAIFAALTPETVAWVVVSDDADVRAFESARAQWGAPGPEVRYVETGRSITNWARDRVAVLDDGTGHVHLLAPPDAHVGATERAHDFLVPWDLRRALRERASIAQAPFRFDGGDLIADETRVYIATPLFERNPNIDRASLIRQVEAATGRPALALGTSTDPAPMHHTGMFVTPLGDGRVAYADPELGSRILFGEDDLAPESETPRTLTAGSRSYAVDESAPTRRRFARVAEDLRGAGLETLRLPLVPTTTPFVWLGYDNVLMSERADGRHVLMPVYGVPVLDDAAAAIWSETGATVHRIPVDEIFHHGGTVRCLAAVLSREPSR